MKPQVSEDLWWQIIPVREGGGVMGKGKILKEWKYMKLLRGLSVSLGYKKMKEPKSDEKEIKEI